MFSKLTSAPGITSLIGLLHLRACQQPEQLAYVFQHDDGYSEDRLTYCELERQARGIASQLQRLSISNGARALLFYPQGLEYIAAFFGCIYAGVIAVPAPHPHLTGLQRYVSRLQGIIENAQPEVVLTTEAILSRLEPLRSHFQDLRDIIWQATDMLSPEQAGAWQAPAVQGEIIAFLQYTSGSTSVPKGVMLSHANVLHNNAMFQRVLQHPPGTAFVSWLPLFHDMGLIASALQALYIGAPCILLSPQAFIQRPLRWLQTISRYQAYTSCAPNFAYDLCTRKIPPAQRSELDLRCWKNAVNGAEPVRSTTLEHFTAAFAPCGFQPTAFAAGYGLAEATVFVSCAEQSARPITLCVDSQALEQHHVVIAETTGQHTRAVVGCGTGSTEQEIVIVDPATRTRYQEGRVGEIWVCGPSVAHGYWQRTHETEQIFRAYLADTGEGPFLRTGDLGFLHDQQLFITGRLKDVIIIDGRNHYPQDIELTVEQSHPALRPGCCAAFAVTVAEQECLVIAAEIERHYRPAQQAEDTAEQSATYRQIIRALRRAISEQHDLPVQAVVLLKPGSIPKTSSGKISRQAARQRFLNNTLEVWFHFNAA